jgi:hypothetical protein
MDNMSEEALKSRFRNPFSPGAGHMPPYLAGREEETREFGKLLEQDVILKNLILTGLRGLGKTVLLETFKPMAIAAGWLWAGADLSESTSVSEDNLATRIITDLSGVTSSIVVSKHEEPVAFLNKEKKVVETKMDFDNLQEIFAETPGLVADKLKAVLERAWGHIKPLGKKGIVFAYDEAQNLADHAAKDQYPLSLLLDVFQSLQRKNIPFMLVLTGLPTLFPKLVEARTYSERMFQIIFLEPLNERDTALAIKNPVEKAHCPIKLSSESVKTIWETTKGYPYFVQYVCREVYDIWVQFAAVGQPPPGVPVDTIIRKLDSDFFQGRWARATDRQRDLLRIVAQLATCDTEFTVQDVVEFPIPTAMDKPFSSSHANQILGALSDVGLVYRNRHGKYSFAVPLLGAFIRRQGKP